MKMNGRTMNQEKSRISLAAPSHRIVAKMSPPPFSSASAGPSSTTHPQMGAPSHRNDYTSIYDQRCAAWGNEETVDLLYMWRDNLQAIQCARNRPAWEHVAHQMILKGHSRTWEQCKTRIHTLVQKFRRTKLPNQPQSQSTDMWRQTAVYEILNDILRNIPGLPWTYEDQDQQNESPSTTPLTQIQSATATVINGMNVRSILSNGVKVEREGFYQETVSSDSAGSGHEEVVPYQGEPGEVPPRGQRHLPPLPKALYSSAIKYSTANSVSSDEGGSIQRGAYVFATVGGSGEAVEGDYMDERDNSPLANSTLALQQEDRGIIVRGSAAAQQPPQHLVDSSSPPIGREVTISSTNGHHHHPPPPPPPSSNHRPRAHTFSASSHHSNSSIAASLILLSQQQPAAAAQLSPQQQQPQQQQMQRPSSVSPTPHDLSLPPSHPLPSHHPSASAGNHPPMLPTTIVTSSSESPMHMRAFSPISPHIIQQQQQQQMQHAESGLNLLSATCHSAAIAASAAGNPPLASEYLPPEPANPEGGSSMEGRPPPIKKQRLLDSLLQSRSSTTSPKNLAIYNAEDTRSVSHSQPGISTSPSSTSHVEDSSLAPRSRAFTHHQAIHHHSRFSPTSAHHLPTTAVVTTQGYHHQQLPPITTTPPAAAEAASVYSAAVSPARYHGVASTSSSLVAANESNVQSANHDLELRSLLQSTIANSNALSIRLDSLVENFTAVQRDMQTQWIDYLRHREVVNEQQRREDRKFWLSVIQAIAPGRTVEIETSGDDKKLTMANSSLIITENSNSSLHADATNLTLSPNSSGTNEAQAMGNSPSHSRSHLRGNDQSRSLVNGVDHVPPHSESSRPLVNGIDHALIDRKDQGRPILNGNDQGRHMTGSLMNHDHSPSSREANDQ